MRTISANPRSAVVPSIIAATLSVCAILLTHLAVTQPLYALGGSLVLVYLIVAWFYPAAALIIIFVAAPFQEDVAGGGIAKMGASEVALALTIPVFLLQNFLRKRPILPGPMTLPILSYLAVCLFSSWVTWRSDTAILSLLQMGLYYIGAVVVFASFARDDKLLLLVPKAAVVLGIALAIAAFATGFHLLGIHKNGIGSSLSMLVLISLEMWLAARRSIARRFYLIALIIIASALVVSVSRGAWLGALAGSIVILALRRQFALLARVMIVLIPVVAISWSFMPQEQRDYAVGFNRERANISARYASIDYAKAQWEKNLWYGVGVGLRKEYDATNLVMLTLAETGILGLIAFAGIHWSFYRMVWTAQKHVRHNQEAYSLVALGAALVTAKLAHGMVDHYWSRGPIMMAWASAGMALSVYYSAPRSRSSDARL